MYVLTPDLTSRLPSIHWAADVRGDFGCPRRVRRASAGRDPERGERRRLQGEVDKQGSRVGWYMERRTRGVISESDMHQRPGSIP